MSGGLILYTAEDGSAALQPNAEACTVWLTQGEIATLLDTTPQSIAQHTTSLHPEEELIPEATCKELLHVRLASGQSVELGITQYDGPDAASFAANADDMAALEPARGNLEREPRGNNQ